MTMQDRQLPIDREILRQLVAATPDTWKQIDYAVDVTWHEGYEDLYSDITSPEGHDPADASVSAELSEATERLLDLMKEYGLRLRTIRGHAWLDDQGRWMYKANFEYNP
jgi:hypothetical protein